jgi:hypothetical protein
LRSAPTPEHCGRGGDPRRAGQGRGHFSGPFGDVTLTAWPALLQEHPFGRHDRLGLLEQGADEIRVGGHLAHLLTDAAVGPYTVRR